MSLLMDALKKAEQEKKEAAKRLKESDSPSLDQGEDGDITQERETPIESTKGDDTAYSRSGYHTASSTMELSLAPIDNTGESETGEDADVTSENENLSLKEDSYPELPAEDVEVTDSLDESGIDESPPRELSLEDSGEENADSSPAGEMDRDESAADPDESFEGIDLDETMDHARFQETIQEEIRGKGSDTDRFYEETLPGVPAAQLAADIGGEDQPTPVAAQTVFTAGTTTRERSAGFKWLLIGTTAVMILAAGIWYYYTVTPINRDLPSPMIARGIETVSPVKPPAEEKTPSAVQSGTLTAGVAAPEASASAAASEPVAGETGTAPSPGKPTGSTGAKSPATASATEARDNPQEGQTGQMQQTTPAVEDGDDTGDSARVPAGQAAAEEGTGESMTAGTAAGTGREAAGLPETIEPPPSMIKISRSKVPEQQSVMLNDAFAAYKNGNHSAARQAYEKVLEQHPDNRDAMMGLAAIALKQDRPQQALRMYARILDLNPRDSLARAALINLSDNPATARSESTIKLMIRDNPELPYLHYALGNVYAAQSRWPEAQQAFFDAYRLDSTNADYALNLAVSLDHMGYSASALDYYQTALDLAGNGGASFTASSLETRIATLKGALQP